MMEKNTARILEELKMCEEFKTFYNENDEHMIKESLADMLNAVIIRKGLKKVDLIANSEISEVYVYQILSGRRLPERNKLICLILEMHIEIDEVQKILRCAGYSPLYAKIPFDSIILYAICKKLSVVETNALLFENLGQTLG